MSIENEKFKSYVTSTAFSLSLSRNMVEMLLWVEYINRDGSQWIWHLSSHTGTKLSLERRGLIKVTVRNVDIEGDSYSRPEAELTEAGACLCQLLHLAGFRHEPYDVGVREEIEDTTMLSTRDREPQP